MWGLGRREEAVDSPARMLGCHGCRAAAAGEAACLVCLVHALRGVVVCGISAVCKSGLFPLHFFELSSLSVVLQALVLCFTWYLYQYLPQYKSFATAYQTHALDMIKAETHTEMKTQLHTSFAVAAIKTRGTMHACNTTRKKRSAPQQEFWVSLNVPVHQSCAGAVGWVGWEQPHYHTCRKCLPSALPVHAPARLTTGPAPAIPAASLLRGARWVALHQGLPTRNATPATFCVWDPPPLALPPRCTPAEPHPAQGGCA